MEKWQLKTESETITITKEKDDFYNIHTDHWYAGIENTLWFTSYQSARKYVREEMFVEGRFKKVKEETK